MSQPDSPGHTPRQMMSQSRQRLIVIGNVALLVVIVLGVVYSQRLLLQSLISGGINFVGGNAGQAKIDLPPGFSAKVYASGLHTPRFMAFGPDGTLFVADEGSGTVRALPDPQHSGTAARDVVIASNLQQPSSLAFEGNTLYIGETTRIRLGPRSIPTSAWRAIRSSSTICPRCKMHSTRTDLLGRTSAVCC